MAQELIIRTWCDVCAAEDVSKEGEAVELAIGAGASARRLDLCGGHVDSLLGPILSAWTQFSAPLDGQPGPRATSPRPVKVRGPRGPYKTRDHGQPQIYPCLLCEASYATRSGSRQHYDQGHHIGAVVTQLGSICPLCGQGHRYGTALADHVLEAHGLPSVDAAMVTAGRDGDKHGVVKAVRKVLTQAAKQQVSA